MEDGRLFIRIFNSTTFTNIDANPKAAANIIDDPSLFVKSALSDTDTEKFEFIEGFPVLKQALGWVIFNCECRRGENISVVDLVPVRGKINKKGIKPVNRGFNAVIEAAVHATRYVGLKEQEYLRQIEYSNTIVQKCGGAREKEAMRLLYQLIGYP